jgi:alanyl-tRNA synthetase
MRIIADHLRASVFLLADGVVPGNLGQQYILRRLIRRLTLQAVNLGIKDFLAPRLVPVVIDIYQSRYPFLPAKQVAIINAFRQEEEKFARIISPARLMKNKAFLADIGKTSATRLEQLKQSAAFAFESLATTGIPYDFQLEQAKELGLVKNKQETSQFEQFFEAKKKEHQQKSRASLKKRFAGGLADKDPATVKLHTVAHLLQQALRQILGSHVTQAGSNITSERLRFDFTHDQKLTSQQLEQVEQLVNLKIEQNLPVTVKTASLSQARQEGALFFFADRYQDEIKIYSIGDFSKEVCGGPHVGSTGEIGSVRIKKQESVGQGKKRLYVVLV